MTTFTSTPQFGGDIAAYIAQQDLVANPDPTTPAAYVYTAATAVPVVGAYSPMDFVNIPAAATEAEMDSVMGLGSFDRLQQNVTATKPSMGFTQKLRTSTLLQSAVRNASGQLNYYSMLTGNSSYARQVSGAKCESMDLDISFESGAVTVAMHYQALYASVLAAADVTTAAIPVMTYNALTLPVYYGYHAAILINADDYTDYIKRIRIGVRHEIERLPTKRKSISIAATPTIVLVSRHLKEKAQTTTVSLELYQGIPVANVSILCRTNPTMTINLTDSCNLTRALSIALADVAFASDKQSEGEVGSILNFAAEANARTFTITEVAAT